MMMYVLCGHIRAFRIYRHFLVFRSIYKTYLAIDGTTCRKKTRIETDLAVLVYASYPTLHVQKVDGPFIYRVRFTYVKEVRPICPPVSETMPSPRYYHLEHRPTSASSRTSSAEVKREVDNVPIRNSMTQGIPRRHHSPACRSSNEKITTPR
jgi:hypothetical protein